MCLQPDLNMIMPAPHLWWQILLSMHIKKVCLDLFFAMGVYQKEWGTRIIICRAIIASTKLVILTFNLTETATTAHVCVNISHLWYLFRLKAQKLNLLIWKFAVRVQSCGFCCKNNIANVMESHVFLLFIRVLFQLLIAAKWRAAAET